MDIKRTIKKLLSSPIVASNEKEQLILQQFETFKQLNDKRFDLDNRDLLLCTNDATTTTDFDSHYIYHPAWAARIIKDTAPAKHIDIGSTLHFCSLLSAFIKTEFYDFRVAQLNLSNLISNHADLTALPFKSNSISSLSCMHTIEHIGLGRYGDPIDPTADLKAIDELKRVCAVNGNLLIVVPIGKRMIRFNAHRIYDPTDLPSYMQGFHLKQFSFINDEGKFIQDIDLKKVKDQTYACGCYWFVKS
ncbi:MAG: DUF268 domain-containing protein [Sphingobacteriaceae bacterium]|nr:MAG: DUF268 domain-containing protein [Sphingobacteriaceae bacterium]